MDIQSAHSSADFYQRSQVLAGCKLSCCPRAEPQDLNADALDG